MTSVSKYLLGFMIFHILTISLIEAFFCQNLKLFQLYLIFFLVGVAFLNSRKINLFTSDLIIIFALILLNIYYLFIDFRGLVYFKMTYVLILSILLSKIVLPFISLDKFLSKLNLIYLVFLLTLILEYFVMATIRDKFFVDTFMCNGVQTGVRGYIELFNVTKEILPFHVSGLNSILLGSQTASQIALTAFIWFIFKQRIKKTANVDSNFYLSLAILSLIMVFLSPTLTAVILLVIIGIIFLMEYTIINYKKPIKSFNKLYLAVFITPIIIFILVKLIAFRYPSLSEIYQVYIIDNFLGFGFFNLKDILFGISLEKELELFYVGEIAFLNQFMKYGFIGFGIFYLSISYYILRTINYGLEAKQNIFILLVFMAGNIHYDVMFSAGAMELFALHLAYLIYVGSDKSKLQL
jgi:hypothetical protein